MLLKKLISKDVRHVIFSVCIFWIFQISLANNFSYALEYT